MSLGSNGVDRVRSLRKILMRLRGTYFCINCSSSDRLHRPSCSNKKSKCTQTLRNAPIHEFRVQWGWIGCIGCEKFWCNFMARTWALIAPVQPVLHRVSCSNEILPNTPKHYKTHTNMSLGSNGVDWVRSLRKILMRLHGMNLCINYTSSTHFAPIFM